MEWKKFPCVSCVQRDQIFSPYPTASCYYQSNPSPLSQVAVPQEDRFVGEPFVCDNSNRPAITYFPLGAFNDKIPSCQQAPPNIGRVATQFSVHKRTVRKIPFIHPVKQWGGYCEQGWLELGPQGLAQRSTIWSLNLVKLRVYLDIVKNWKQKLKIEKYCNK